MPRPIDAHALLNEINELKKSPWYNGENGNYERLVRSDAIGVVVDLCIKDAPTLDYAPVRHGEWIKDKDDLYWGNHFIHQRCSLCGGEPHINRFGTAYILSDYCPNCGALMDRKEEAHG